jgi:predicted AlkP superfamily pyrophosphatase or phosphodiesterase
MPFVKYHTDHLYLARATTPTVTLPRLKALTRGVPPKFSDLLFNFAAEKSVSDDDIVSSFKSTSSLNRILLLGDDTWKKMYPSNTFLNRSDFTKSFFTKDITEVDSNVSRHIDSTFDPTMKHPHSSDWDVAILHYLGLDHVGHQLGPSHPIMSRKLDEMGHTFHRIYDNLLSQDRISGKRTLLVLLSGTRSWYDFKRKSRWKHKRGDICDVYVHGYLSSTVCHQSKKRSSTTNRSSRYVSYVDGCIDTSSQFGSCDIFFVSSGRIEKYKKVEQNATTSYYYYYYYY